MKCNGDVNCSNNADFGYCKEHDEYYGKEVLELHNRIGILTKKLLEAENLQKEIAEAAQAFVNVSPYSQIKQTKQFMCNFCGSKSIPPVNHYNHCPWNNTAKALYVLKEGE